MLTRGFKRFIIKLNSLNEEGAAIAFKLKDLARRLGVSPSTVSLALHNRPGVSEATRARVFEALREEGLEALIPAEKPPPRNVRLVLYKNGKEIITDTPFFLQLIEGIDRQAKKDGLNLMVSYLTAGPGVAEQVGKLRENGCEGIILLATEMTPEQTDPFRALGLPLVALDENFEEAGLDCVAISNALSMRRAVEHLLRLGHKRIGYLKGTPSIRNFTERFEGYRQAMAAAGLALPEGGIVESAPSAEAAYTAMRRYLSELGKLPCTAYVADNDNLLCGAMKALREYDIAVPERVSVVGFDGLPAAEFFDPPLTTIRVPKRQMGGMAVSLLSALMDGAYETPVAISVGTELILRKSTAPPTLDE